VRTNWQAVLFGLAGMVLVWLVGAAAGPPKLIHEDGRWRISNGRVELSIDKSQATLVHLAAPGGPELITLGYYDTNGQPGGFGRSGYLRFGRHEPAIAEVAQQTDGMVDVLLRTERERLKPGFNHPLLTELHYVLRRDEPGFYVYWLRWHERTMPAFELDQTRYVIRASRAVFDQWRIADDRHGTFPTPAEAKAAKEVYNATFQLPDGRYMTKYANAVAIADHHLCGLYSRQHGLGLWQINPSNEYINGGPTKQNLTIHQLEPILLHMAQSRHFGGRPARVRGKWCKLFGPIFFYINRAASLDEAWADAKKRMAVEQSRWPYSWVKPRAVPNAYPLRRGSVDGVVKRTDGQSPAGAFAILAAPDPAWPFQGFGYMYWQRVGEDGRFHIPHVRAGLYTLYVFQPGVFGETRRDGVSLCPGDVADIGEVGLTPETHGRLVWQIGVPDRTAAEYRHGRDFRRVYLHRLYAREFPNGVHFEIGRSREARDWNYYQPGGSTWRVKFQLRQLPAHGTRLTVALAASSYHPPANIEVSLNGQSIRRMAFDDGDSALWRLSIYDRYQIRVLSLPTAAMHQGKNELALTLPHRRMWIMYDFLRLEAGE